MPPADALSDGFNRSAMVGVNLIRKTQIVRERCNRATNREAMSDESREVRTDQERLALGNRIVGRTDDSSKTGWWYSVTVWLEAHNASDPEDVGVWLTEANTGAPGVAGVAGVVGVAGVAKEPNAVGSTVPLFSAALRAARLVYFFEGVTKSERYRHANRVQMSNGTWTNASRVWRRTNTCDS